MGAHLWQAGLGDLVGQVKGLVSVWRSGQFSSVTGKVLDENWPRVARVSSLESRREQEISVDGISGIPATPCKGNQSGARDRIADPVGQDKSSGATPRVTPCLHNLFSTPFVQRRDAGLLWISSCCCSQGWRQVSAVAKRSEGARF